MAKCDACGREENMPYQCRHCGGTYCGDHRLPENHSCPGLENWNDPDGVFDSGFDDTVDGSGGGGWGSSTAESNGIASRLGINTGPGGILGYFRGNVTYLFLGIIWAVFLIEHIVLFTLGEAAFRALFVISPANPEYVWTWVTSIFSHAPLSLFHIGGNSIVIFFFGRIVERYVGSRDFALLFLGSGVLAGLGQIAIQAYQGNPAGALGASGAALAIMGVLTVLNPNLKVYLYFLLPVPIWVITIGYAGLSALGIVGGVGGGIAHVAHAVGLALGLLYGQRVKDKLSAPGQLQLGGGMGRGPGGPGGPGGRGPF
ncbi:rhomboid family intramembrane serine protease [Halorientalis sp.]|uniref:rhomboid family intramembrane serine protease n=1 Tax=Halorientalis sp. TaxID=1931229 RepID=UPI00262DFBCC|nr:rhomboid family intramembrane serine protease [Halorientalis sp.]